MRPQIASRERLDGGELVGYHLFDFSTGLHHRFYKLRVYCGQLLPTEYLPYVTGRYSGARAHIVARIELCAAAFRLQLASMVAAGRGMPPIEFASGWHDIHAVGMAAMRRRDVQLVEEAGWSEQVILEMDPIFDPFGKGTPRAVFAQWNERWVA